MVDSKLPAITYISAGDGTVSVSRSGSSTTVTVSNLKLIGSVVGGIDSIFVSGTITKN